MRLLVGALCLVLAGCGSTPRAGGNSSGCGVPQTAGARSGTITVNGVDRGYTVVVPAGYTASTPLALVLGWHGSTGTGSGMHAANTGLETAAAGGAIFVYPQGLPILGVSNGACSVLLDIPFNAGGPGLISSQSGQSCVGWDWRPNGRDIAFFDALVDSSNSASIVSNFCIDTHRIYSLGFSSGGFFTENLACNRSQLIKGAAVMSGGLPPWTFAGRSYPGQGCTALMFPGSSPPAAGADVSASNPAADCGGAAVPTFFVGNSSGDQPYDGCTIAAGQALDFNVQSHGCGATTTPVSLPADSVQSTCNRYACSQAAVFSCTYTNSNGHAPPPPTSSAQAAIWTFFTGAL